MFRPLVCGAAICAAPAAAQEAQVTETRTAGERVFAETNTGILADGTVLSAQLFWVPYRVVYTRVAGDPLTQADFETLTGLAYVCDGPRIEKTSSSFSPDRITFDYQCLEVGR